uniref:Agouti-signaling protein n=1 Tax=Varanus komodoensis TaxID=61221 RepID=A0A8D2LS06_VARKO
MKKKKSFLQGYFMYNMNGLRTSYLSRMLKYILTTHAFPFPKCVELFILSMCVFSPQKKAQQKKLPRPKPSPPPNCVATWASCKPSSHPCCDFCAFCYCRLFQTVCYCRMGNPNC